MGQVAMDEARLHSEAISTLRPGAAARSVAPATAEGPGDAAPITYSALGGRVHHDSVVRLAGSVHLDEPVHAAESATPTLDADRNGMLGGSVTRRTLRAPAAHDGFEPHAFTETALLLWAAGTRQAFDAGGAAIPAHAATGTAGRPRDLGHLGLPRRSPGLERRVVSDLVEDVVAVEVEDRRASERQKQGNQGGPQKVSHRAVYDS
jgi:hypothetical protein